jgi:hypothetical protein
VSDVDVALAAAATLIASAFALSTWDRWLRKRRPQEEAWTVSLILFAVGSGALWWGLARGWSAGSFRMFYLAGAILNVPWLALGTLSLVMPHDLVRRLRTGMIAATGLATGVVLVAPMKGSVPAGELPEGRELFGVFPRVLAAVGSGVAALVIIAVAVVTTTRFLRQRVVPVRRVVGNLTIALGTLVLSASGTLAGRLGEQRAFVVTLLIGVVLLFSGFLATALPAARPSSVVRSATRQLPSPA